MTYDDWVELLGADAKGMARCPNTEGHTNGDRSPSLSIDRGREDGHTVLKCFAGCPTEKITEAVGRTMADLFERRNEDRHRDEVITSYRYVDEAGTLLYEAVRKPGKRFVLRRPDGRGGWIWNAQGVRRVLYRLPEVIAAVAAGQPVYVVEGEKDCDRLGRIGIVATTNATGAGKWDTVPDAPEVLTGAEVIVVADLDPPGDAHARQVVTSLLGKASSITVVVSATGVAKSDVSDHLDAGHDLAQLVAVAPILGMFHDFTVEDWLAEQPETGAAQPPDDGPPARQRLAATQMSTVTPEDVTWLWPGRLPLGKLVVLDGDPAVGKSTMTTDIAARMSMGAAMPDQLGGGAAASVVIMSAEDGLADTIRPRLDAAGADVTRIHAVTAVKTIDDDGVVKDRPPSIPDDVALLEDLVRQTGAKLVIVDVLMAYLGGTTNSYRDQDVRLALAPLAAMAERCGCCVLVLRHVRKASTGNALYAGGGSIGIIGAARVGLIAAYDPDDDNPDENLRRRVLAVVKCNIAPKAASLGYSIVSSGAVGRIDWHGPVAHRADDLVDHEGRDDERGDKEDFLRDLLGDGPVEFRTVEKAAHVAGWTVKQLRPALKRLGGTAKPGGFQQPVVWRLPDSDAPSDASDAHIRTRSSLASLGHHCDPEDAVEDAEDAHVRTRAPSAPSGHLQEGDEASADLLAYLADELGATPIDDREVPR